jgi:hypothetical protein
MCFNPFSVYPISYDFNLTPDYFLADFFALALTLFFIGLPQHQIVVADAPQESTITSLPQGIHANLEPFFNFFTAILHLLLFIFFRKNNFLIFIVLHR